MRVIVERDPVEHYARLMLGRTLERQGRADEAESHLRLASALAGALAEAARWGQAAAALTVSVPETVSPTLSPATLQAMLKKRRKDQAA